MNYSVILKHLLALDAWLKLVVCELVSGIFVVVVVVVVAGGGGGALLG